MPLRKTWSNNISTPIPSTTDPDTIISILHDHGYLITMSPIVTRYEKATPTTDLDRINYTVWENIDVLPGALWRKEINFQCAFKNSESGVTSWINAPMGLTSQATYTVKNEEGSWVLYERIESSCNVLLKGFVEKTMVQTRKEMHQKILAKAEEREKTGHSSQEQTAA